jgi:chitodextrinase
MGHPSIRRLSIALHAAFLTMLVLSVVTASASNVEYEVDAASGRVTRATFPDETYIEYAYDNAGNRISAVVHDMAGPGAPGAPSFSNITASSATATWTAAADNIGVTSYEWSRNGGSTWTSVGASLSVNITGLAGSTNCTVLVRARDAANNPGSSSSNSFTTLPAADTVAPGAPGTPSFSTITATSANATWTAATDNVGVTGYEYSLNGGAWTATGSSSPGVSLSSLSSGVAYNFAVRAKDAANNSGPSATNSFSTLDNVAPSAPGTPSFSSITASSATASWTAASDNVGVTSYEWSRNGGSSWTSVGSALSASITGLTGSTSYIVLVRARDAANNVGSASSNSFTTTDTTAPSAPGTPSFSSITGSSATASWGAATDNVAVTGYEYSLNGGGWTSTGTSTSVGLTGLSQATNYSFQVRARDAANNLGPASSNSFSTLDTSAPSTPGTPSFSSLGSTTAVASWGAASDNVGVVRFEYSVNGGGWVNVGNTTSATVSGLSAGTSNTVAVRAVDGAGNAGGSSSASVTTIAQVTIANRDVVISATFQGAAVYQLRSSGDIWSGSSTSVTDTGDWLAPKTGMSSFQVRATPVSGACTSGTMNSWLSISDVSWSVGKGPPPGQATCTFDLQIRHTGNPSVILGTARIYLSITTS